MPGNDRVKDSEQPQGAADPQGADPQGAATVVAQGSGVGRNEPGVWRRIFSRKMLVCCAIGFSSGLPLYVLIQTLPVWMAQSGVDVKSIGLFALTQMPYTFKFLWAPALDRRGFWGMGRRKAWMLASQLLIAATISLMAFLRPERDLAVLAWASLALAFFSATQDVAIDAFRREILDDNELALGSSLHVNAYRLSSLVPGSLALILAELASWPAAFAATAVCMIPGVLVSLLAKEPTAEAQPRTWAQTITLPFKDFFVDRGWKPALLALSFIFFYKLGDSLATSLASPFYLSMGYSKVHIGLVVKNVALWCSIGAGLVGGAWMLKLGVNRGLWIFGFVQILSIPGYALLASQGHFETVGAVELTFLALVVGFEYIGVGLGSAAYVAYISRLTNPLHAAAQFALLTGFSAIPRSMVNASAGFIVDNLGYETFFWLCTALAVPGMVLLRWAAPWNGAAPQKSPAPCG